MRVVAAAAPGRDFLHGSETAEAGVIVVQAAVAYAGGGNGAVGSGSQSLNAGVFRNKG